MIPLKKRVVAILSVLIGITFFYSIQPSVAIPKDRTDPFQWMKSDHNKTVNWLISESKQSEKILNDLTWYSKIEKRIHDLDNIDATDNAEESCSSVASGENCFYFSWSKEFPYNRLFMKDDKGKENLLVDPPVGYRIKSYYPSYDKKYIAYELFKNGFESTSIKFVRVKDGKILPETITPVYFPGVMWSKDSRSLFYTKKSISSLRIEDTYATVYRHDIGTPVAKDTIIFDKKNAPNLASKEDVYLDFNYHWAIVGVNAGVSNSPLELYLSRYTHLTDKKVNWTKIVDKNKNVERYYFYNDSLYLAKVNAVSGYTISRLDLNNPQKPEEKIIEWKNGPFENWGIIDDYLYVVYKESNKSKFKWISMSDISNIQDITLPYDGDIWNINFDSDKKTISYKLKRLLKLAESFTYHLDTKKIIKSTDVKPQTNLFSDYEVETKWVESKDNVRVPLTIIHRKGAKLDSASPTWLRAYGAYGEIQTDFLFYSDLAWLERGGIIAYAHVRGGGELGPAWHSGGSGANKINSVLDFINCAEYLINNHYTSSSKLVISGRSAGAITIGMAIAMRPELFAAAAIDAGMLNVSLLDKIPIGAMNFIEFGSPFNQQGKVQLASVDAYLNLHNGVKYPAILLSVGLTDERVSIWQTAKFAARLKEIKEETKNKNPVLVLAYPKKGHSFYNQKNMMNFFIWQTYLSN